MARSVFLSRAPMLGLGGCLLAIALLCGASGREATTGQPNARAEAGDDSQQRSVRLVANYDEQVRRDYSLRFGAIRSCPVRPGARAEASSSPARFPRRR